MIYSKKLSKVVRNATLLLCSLLLSVGSIVAQDASVTGKVTDAKGEPIVGGYVLLQGTSTGASTDIDGKYSINVAPNATLVFTSMGYKDQVVAVQSRAIINIVMEEDALFLDDAVVTAMGIKKERKALGYSVTEMSSKELLKNKNTNIVNSLAGKVPGVNITQSSGAAGAGSTIVIRGGNSANEGRDNTPLFVVDGIIYDNSTPNGDNTLNSGISRTSTTFGNRGMDINPEDIETMSVLKGAAAAALYGSRAADGVVIITTKKGQEGSVSVNYSTKYSYAWANRVPELQNTYGRGVYNVAGLLETENGTMSSWGLENNESKYDNIANFFEGAGSFDNSVNVSGGGKNNSFFLSASSFNQDGIIPTTGFDKQTFRFNGEQKIGEIFTVGANVSYSIAKTTKTLTSSGLWGGGGNGTMNALYGWPTSEDMSKYLNEDGTKHYIFPTDVIEPYNQMENPYWIINKNNMTDDTRRFTGGLNINANVAPWFQIMYRAGLDTYNAEAYSFVAPGANSKEYDDGRLSRSNVTYNYISSNLMLNFNKKVGDFDLNLLLGQTMEMSDRFNTQKWGKDFVIDGNPGGVITFNDILNDNKFFNETNTQKRLVGVYGELRAAYKNIAYLTVTGRNDWSSTLAPESRSYFYPSVSGSFVFTELMPKSDILSFGKVRASWAEVGKDADPYSLGKYLWPSASVGGGYIGVGNNWTAGDAALKPERQRAWELGLEMRFFNGRLGVDYTYYKSETRDQIIAPRLAQSTGYIFLTLNSGSVKNEGMELAITGTPVETKNFKWDMTLNLSGNRGTLGDFLDGVDLLYVTDVQSGGCKAASVPNGGNFLGLTGDEWVKHENGDYIVDPATGLYKTTKVTTNIVGNREPSFIGGFNNTLQYKNLSLSFLFDLRVGGDIYNGTEYSLLMNGLSTQTLERNEVTVSGVDKDGNPLAYTYKSGQMYDVSGAQKSGDYMIQQYYANYAQNSHNLITNTNWLRLRSLSLNYDFTSLISKQNVIKGLSANISGNNLWLWTNYNGMDPEVSSAGSGAGGAGSVGIDYCGVPATAGLTFGINVTF